MPLKTLRYILASICLISGIGVFIIFFSYSINLELLIIDVSYFLAAYLFIAPLMGRTTIPANWSEKKIAILFSISTIIAAINFLNPWSFLAVALGIKLNAKEELGYSKMINKSLKIMGVIFIIAIVVAVASFIYIASNSSIGRMVDH